MGSSDFSALYTAPAPIRLSGAINHGFRRRPAVPAQHALSLRRREAMLSPEARVTSRTAGSKIEAMRRTKSGSERVGHLLGTVAKFALLPRFPRPTGSRRWRKIAPRPPRGSHGADVHIGNIAHVDDAEAEPRIAGEFPGEQALDHLHGTEAFRRQDGAENRARQDRRQGRWAGMLGHEIPRGTFGQRFRLPIGIQALAVGSVQMVSSLRLSVLHGGEAEAAARGGS